MNTLEVKRLLRSDPIIKKDFRGVFAMDEPPPPPPPYPAAYVFNLDKKSKPGSHWVAVYLANERCAEVFDSYGIHPFGHLYEFAKTHAEDVVYSTKWMQSLHSWLCGAYCVYFLHFRCRGYTLRDIVSHFKEYDFENNDNLVYEVLKTLQSE